MNNVDIRDLYKHYSLMQNTRLYRLSRKEMLQRLRADWPQDYQELKAEQSRLMLRSYHAYRIVLSVVPMDQAAVPPWQSEEPLSDTLFIDAYSRWRTKREIAKLLWDRLPADDPLRRLIPPTVCDARKLTVPELRKIGQQLGLDCRSNSVQVLLTEIYNAAPQHMIFGKSQSMPQYTAEEVGLGRLTGNRPSRSTCRCAAVRRCM